MRMNLETLLGPETPLAAGAHAPEITGLTADSRAVRPGFLFVAIPGTRLDGARFASDAVARGAVAVLAAPAAELSLPAHVVLVRHEQPRRALALLAARFHARQPETVVAVTGTSGKTSVAEFTRQIFKALGRRAASLGTMGIVRPDGAHYGSLTTPDPVVLHETLAGLAADGVTHLAMEASSHGLDQHRLDGVRLVAGAFTNLGRDHLDYHATVADYLAAKLRLFEALLEPGRTAVINADDAHAGEVAALARRRGLAVTTVGVAGATLRLVSAERQGFRQRLVVEHEGRRHDIQLGLIGDYQASNALVAAALAMATGEAVEPVLAALATLVGVKGRLEVVGERAGGLAIVDYAHKPEALAAALAAVRPFATGRLVCVFGCGGDRDRGKRPIMGRIATDGADEVIITDDNPRSESPAAIRAEVLAGATGAREIGDRRAAIRTAVAGLGAGDVLLVAGKGHETGQIIGDVTLPFSDQEEVAAALAEGAPHG